LLLLPKEENIMDIPIDWLLQGEPWIEYRTRIDLLGQPEQDSEVNAARLAMLAQAPVQELVEGLSFWPGTVISNHKSAGQPFHKLTFLADLGLKKDDPDMDVIIARIMQHKSEEGPFQLPTQVPLHFGGTGGEQWAWSLCDAPLILYALIKFGLKDDPAAINALEYLTGLVNENGWPCTVSKELGKFHGPGRKEDPCPYATLAMLKALAANEDMRDCPACHLGADVLLNLWQESLTKHPYIFYMGTDFRKLKVPFVWYDLMHVLDVLSQFPWLRQDPRLQDMLALMEAKADERGCFTLESVWTAWKDWEFGQKKAPSRWLTLSAWRIIRRIHNA
jgi:hypothetical protein